MISKAPLREKAVQWGQKEEEVGMPEEGVEMPEEGPRSTTCAELSRCPFLKNVALVFLNLSFG
jgi:hypothetical protein